MNKISYQDLDALQRDNIAKAKAFQMGRRNILPEDPIAKQQIIKMDLSEIEKDIETVINSLLAVDGLLYRIPGPEEERSPEDDTQITLKLTKAIEKMMNLNNLFVDISSDPEDIKKIDSKEWNKKTKRFKDILRAGELLTDLVLRDVIGGDIPSSKRNVEQGITRMAAVMGRLKEAFDDLSSNIRTFGAGRKVNSTSDVEFSKPSPYHVQWRFR